MRVLDAIPSPARRRWFIAVCLVPFALLGIWSILLIRSARAAHHELNIAMHVSRTYLASIEARATVRCTLSERGWNSTTIARPIPSRR